jgi:hypothetical protein
MRQPPNDRIGVIQGLRELADFLAQHPDLPVPLITQISYCALGDTDAEEQAEIDKIAKLLDRTAEYTTAGHYSVSRLFASVEYRAFTVPEHAMREYVAKNSYRDSIQIDRADSEQS